MKLDTKTIGFINVFENLTGCKVKDCIEDNDKLIFLVEESTLGKALGKNGSTIQRVKSIMKKEIQVLAFSSDLKKFISYLIFPNKADDIAEADGVVTIKVAEKSVKGRIFGRNRENLKRIYQIVKRHFNVKEIRISDR